MDTAILLQQTAEQIKKIRPAYGPILDFFSQVFMAQEQSKKDIRISPIIIEPGLLKAKLTNGMPLIDPSEFIIDTTQAIELFEKICNLAQRLAPGLSSTAHELKKALKENTLQMETLFSAILHNQVSTIYALAADLNVPEETLIFFGYKSIAPSVAVCAEQLGSYLPEMPNIGKGYCPICGNLPDIAFLDQEGKQHVKCNFCSYQWRVKRMGCLLCDNNDKDMQHYFFSDEEKEYRVALCDHCNRYIKVVDLRQMNRAFYPDLELACTLHLDMKAREKGYASENNLYA